MKKIIIVIIAILLLILVGPEIDLRLAKITQYNQAEIIENIYTSKFMSKEEKEVLILKLTLNYNKYLNKRIFEIM